MTGEDAVIGVLRDAGVDPAIVVAVEARLLDGRMTYGAWTDDGRDWIQETTEELLDALAYTAAARHYQHAGAFAALVVIQQIEAGLVRLGHVRART